jgi:cell division septum initiation protein DivIVA
MSQELAALDDSPGSVHNQRVAKSLTPEQLRNPNLPMARRGFEEESTRRFLSDAADALNAVTRERDDLQKRVAELSEHAAHNPTDAETIGAVLMTAQRVADDLVAKATEEVAALYADAQRERDVLLVQAQDDADALATDAAASVESLKHEEERLRHSLATYRQEVVLFLRAALEQLDGIEALDRSRAEAPKLDGELLTRLPSE